MNTTITSVAATTNSNNAREYAAKMIAWAGKRVRATFIKKDGAIRTMICVPKNAWNEQNGIETTTWGKKMIRTKVSRNMVTVCELLDSGVFQPRTINLGRILALELAA